MNRDEFVLQIPMPDIKVPDGYMPVPKMLCVRPRPWWIPEWVWARMLSRMFVLLIAPITLADFKPTGEMN